MQRKGRITILIALSAVFLMVCNVSSVNGQENELPTQEWFEQVKKDIGDSFADWIGESNQQSALYGISVGTAGDVNGDGYSDIIVGASLLSNGENNEGSAFVYYGSASGLSTIANWIGESNQQFAHYGISVGTAGDVNGDGYSDIIIGAWAYSNGEAYEGRAYVYHGSASGLSTTANWIGESNQANAAYGDSVGTAGDVNGDGYSDIIVGASLLSNGETYEGRAYVYHGSASGLSTTANWIGESNQKGAFYGTSVGTAGDVNGDGYSDIIVGAQGYSNADLYENRGRAYVYYGSAFGISSTANWTKESNQKSAYYGHSVGTAGDVNGDGYSDIIVGSLGHSNGEWSEGSAFVYYGSASGLSKIADWTGQSNQAAASYGYSVGTAGDVNGDGYSDIIVGDRRYSNGETAEGSAFVYYGSASGLTATASWTGESNQKFARYGTSVGTAGDVNGDGYSDIIVGSSAYSNGETDEGSAYVYHGSVGNCEPITLSAELSLHIPQIVHTTIFGDKIYKWADFEYITNQSSSNDFFKLVDNGNINFNSHCEYATMTDYNSKLHLPHIEYYTTSDVIHLWADFEYLQSSSNNIVFKMTTLETLK